MENRTRMIARKLLMGDVIFDARKLYDVCTSELYVSKLKGAALLLSSPEASLVLLTKLSETIEAFAEISMAGSENLRICVTCGTQLDTVIDKPLEECRMCLVYFRNVEHIG